MARVEPLKPPGYTLFLGNLDSRVTDKLLYELCCQAGPVESVRIQGTGGRPYAFIKYRDLAGAMYAVALLRGRVSLFNMPVSINFSNQPVDKDEWSEEDKALWDKCQAVLAADNAPAVKQRDPNDLPPLAPRAAGRHPQQHAPRDHRPYDEDDDQGRYQRNDRQRASHSYSSPGGLQQWSPGGRGSPAPAAAAAAAAGGGGGRDRDRDRADRDAGYADYPTPGSDRYVQDNYQQRGAANGYGQQQEYHRQYQQQQQPAATPYGQYASPHQPQQQQQQQQTPGAYSAAALGTPATPYALPGAPTPPAAAAGYQQQQQQQQQYGGQLQWQVQPLGQAAAAGAQHGLAGRQGYHNPGTTPTQQQQYGQHYQQQYQQPAQQQHQAVPGGYQAAGLVLSQAAGVSAYNSPAAAIPGLGGASPYLVVQQQQRQQQPPPPPPAPTAGQQAYPPAPGQQQHYQHQQQGGFQGAYQHYGYR